MSLKKSLSVVAFGSAVALSLYGVGCGGSSGGKQQGDGGGGSSGTKGSGSGGSGGTMGTMGSGGSGGKGGSGGISPFEGGADGGGSCTPGSVSSTTFGLNPSAQSIGCTTTQIKNIVDDCLGGNPDAGSTACTDLLADTATKACYGSCVFSPWTATSSLATYTAGPWGGIVYNNPYLPGFVNLGGCIQNATAGTPQAAAGAKCATDQEESLECVLQACTSECKIPTPPMSTQCSADPACAAAQMALDGCITAASMGDCATYNTAASTDCASVMADSGPLVDCVSAFDILTGQAEAGPVQFTTAFEQYLDIICTGSVPDGG